MTQTRPPRSRRDPNVRCRGIVYGFNILDPATREIRVDYVGKTVQRLDARELQHRGADEGADEDEQPWSDLIVGKPFIIEEGWWTAGQLAEREVFHIHRLKPRYNDRHNRGNPDRIPIPEARRQRAARDAARGVPSPVWKTQPPVRTQFSRRSPAPVRREWSRRQKQTAAVAAVWLVLASAGWWAVCRWLPVDLADGAVDGAVAASALLTLAGALSVRTRRRGAGWGRFWRALGLGAAGAGVVFLLWHLGPAIMLLLGAHGTGQAPGRI